MTAHLKLKSFKNLNLLNFLICLKLKPFKNIDFSDLLMVLKLKSLKNIDFSDFLMILKVFGPHKFACADLVSWLHADLVCWLQICRLCRHRDLATCRPRSLDHESGQVYHSQSNGFLNGLTLDDITSEAQII